MASLIQKTQTLISANLHDMVDKALEKNSVAVMKQYIRDAEKNLDELSEAAATVGGEVKGLERRYKQYKKEADKIDRNIDLLLTQGKTDLARAAQSELNIKRRLQEQYHEQWVSQQKEYQALLNARTKLQAKMKTIRLEMKEMEALLRLAESKEKTVKAIKSIEDLQGVGDGDIARLGESIRGRLDRATAESEMHASSLDNQMDEVIGASELDIQLEERKRRLGISAAPEPSFADEFLEEDAAAEAIDTD